MKENKSLKRKLIVQSFAPLFFILFIKYMDKDLVVALVRLAKFMTSKEKGLDLCGIITKELIITLILEMFCLIMIVYAFYSLLSFANIQTYNFRSQGEKLCNVKKIHDSGVVFFMTYILPLTMDNINTIQGISIFVILMLMVYVLMWKTNLYYQNPVLTILNYKTYTFEFSQTQISALKDKECIAITRENLEAGRSIKRQYIADNVFLIYIENKRVGTDK